MSGSGGNAALALGVALPSFLFYRWFLACTPSSGSRLCEWGASHPLGLLNLMFLLNVNVLFWIISLIQRSTWLIDPYWSFLPVLMAHYFATHPACSGNPWRSRLLIALVWIWSIRLTHSYFRREEWKWGAREDWRFAEMRRQYKSNWWWISFFAVYASQQVFLVGICLPAYAVHRSIAPLNSLDAACALICLTGITIAYFADTQLDSFVKQQEGQKPILLDTGLWRYSRHPNYFGEQVWWWGIALFGYNVGQAWTMLGAAVNTACLAYVTLLVEKRMMADERRAAAYSQYRASTSVWMPWFNKTHLP